MMAAAGKPRLIVITGSVGTGKTSAAEELSRLIGHVHVDVGKTVLENRRALGAGRDRKRKVLVANLEKTRRFLKRRGLLRRGHIVEGHYAHDLVDKPDFVFVLRCDPKELDRRLAGRGYGEDKRAENILAEILDACSIEAERRFGNRKVFEIDTTGRTAARIGAILKGVIEGKRQPPGKIIDFSRKYLAGTAAGRFLPQ